MINNLPCDLTSLLYTPKGTPAAEVTKTVQVFGSENPALAVYAHIGCPIFGHGPVRKDIKDPWVKTSKSSSISRGDAYSTGYHFLSYGTDTEEAFHKHLEAKMP
jgi:hypothetical protein